MSALRSTAALVVASAFASVASAQENSWVGKTIIVKKGGIKIGHTDKITGEQVDDATLTGIDYKVLAEQGDWIKVKHHGVEGWFDKTDAVLLEHAVGYFTERIRQNDQDDGAYGHRAWSWQLKGQLATALKDYDEAIRLNPTSAAWWNNRGCLLRDNKDYDRAIKDFDEALHLQPEYAYAWRNRGNCWYGKTEYDRAVKDLSEAIRLDPKYATAYFDRARALDDKGEHDQALKDLDEAIRLDPKFAAAYHLRGYLWQKKGDRVQATRDFGEAVRLDPKLADAPKSPRWTHAFDLKVRQVGEEKFTDKTQTFGIEVFGDDNNGNRVYVLETGMIGAVTGFDNTKAPFPNSKPPAFLHGLDLKVRRTGEAKFTDKTQVISLEVFRDGNTGNLIYITGKGFLAVGPIDNAAATPTPSPRPPVWVSGLDLKVRKAGQPRFDETARSWSLEVFRDPNTGLLLYVSEAGAVAVVAGEAPAPGGVASQQPSWLHGLDLKCRMGRQTRFDPADKGYGLEVYRDNSHGGNLIYICENGNLAVVPGGKDLNAPTPKPQEPVWKHGLYLKVRRTGEANFTLNTRVVGVEVFRDGNTGNLICITEVGSVSAVPSKP